MQKLNKWLLFINLFFLQSYLIRFQIGTYPSNLQEILIGLNALTLLGIWINEKRLPHFKKHWIIYLFATLSIISLITTTALNQIDLYRHLKFLFFASTLTVIFTETCQTNEQKTNAIQIASLGALIFGIFSLTYNLLGHNVANDLRLLGPLDAAVYLAYYLTPFFIFEVTQLSQKKGSWLRTIIFAALIIATKSMGAIGGSFLAITFYLIKKNRLLHKTSAKIILTLLIISISTAIFYTKILPTLHTEYSSLDERSEIWTTATHLISEPKNILFGLGLSQFEAHYIATVDQAIGRPPLDYKVIQPHNIFFLFIFQYGILGLIALIYLTIAIAKKPLNIWQPILLYFFIHGLIDTPFYKNDLLAMIFIFLTLALTSTPSPIPSEPPQDHPL